MLVVIIAVDVSLLTVADIICNLLEYAFENRQNYSVFISIIHPAAISPTQFDFCSPYSLPRMHLCWMLTKPEQSIHYNSAHKRTEWFNDEIWTWWFDQRKNLRFSSEAREREWIKTTRKSKFANSGPTTPFKNILNWKQTTRSAQRNANCLANNDALPCHFANSRNSLPFIHRRRPKRYLFRRTEWTNERKKSQNVFDAHRHRRGKWKFKNGNIWQCSSTAFKLKYMVYAIHATYVLCVRFFPCSSKAPTRVRERERVREKQKDRSDNVRAFHYMRFIRIRINNLMVSTRA